MVRKSERSKVGTDKTDKPATSRKTTRSSRRRKKSTSESEPEPDVPAEETAEEIPLPPQPQPVTEVTEAPEPPKTPGRRGRPRRQPAAEDSQTIVEAPEEPPKANQEWNEDENFWGESSKQAEAEPTKKHDENSTWKIQSSNGSGGEIQKLKICRQRLTDSAESSSSPAKEIPSPRRKRYSKRKDKDHHLDLDGAESTGSHTDTETPPGTVLDTVPSVLPEPPQDPPEHVGSTSHQEENEEIPLPLEEPVAQEANSATSEETQAQAPVPDAAVPKDEKSQDAVEIKEIVDEEKGLAEIKEEAGASKAVTEETISESSETIIVEPEADIDLTDVPAEATPAKVQIEVTKDSPEKAPDTEEVQASDVEEAPGTSFPTDGEDVEEGELKPAKKPPRNLKLAVSNEDAMQQIAKKLNERAARFSKEATEEAARRSVPHKSSKGNAIEEEEEEGEISRDPSSTKTLELKRLSDDDVEPANIRRDRKRRPVTVVTPTNPSSAQKGNALETAKQQDVSTELLLSYVPDVIEPVSEEEVHSILVPKENEPEVQEVHSDDAGSVCEAGEILEEEGELVEEEKEERRRSVEDRRVKKASSRDEPKRTERRVTKESKDGVRKASRKERRPSDDEPRAKKKYEKEDKDKKSPSKHRAAERVDKPEIPKPVENHKSVRKIAIVSDDTKSNRRSVSPPTKKASCILFITNLVRPFTIGQLKELLNRTGTISPNGFYIDKIKSKCFVKYNDVEMAIETRHALHGVRWPVTNPRTLRVDFSTDDAMEAVKKQAEDEDNAAKKQDLVAQNIDKGWFTEKDIMKPPKKLKNLVREWDMGKDVSEIAPVNEVKKGKEDEWGVKAKDKTKEDGQRRRHISPSQDKTEPAKKIKRRDTDAPAKLLDDLFRKTNATPCIYWLPLTAAQIAVKEEMRRQHMAEHQKRLAELRKSETSRRDKDKSRDRDRERERARDRRRK